VDIVDYDSGKTRHLKRGSEVQITGFIRYETNPGEVVVQVEWRVGDDWVGAKPLLKFFRADAPSGKKSKTGRATFSMSAKELVSALDYYTIDINLTSPLFVFN